MIGIKKSPEKRTFQGLGTVRNNLLKPTLFQSNEWVLWVTMREQKVIVNLLGRGDKDIFQVYDCLKAEGILTDGHLSKESLAAFQEKYHLI